MAAYNRVNTVNTIAFKSYLKSGGLETKRNYWREAW